MKEHSQPIRAAAYCRVSTLQEEQEGSYELQMAYFRRKIEEHPGMVLAGLYGDRGKSGLKATGRSGLSRLMADYERGQIDVILTKSVSRLARNMADCVECIRRLRELQVTVYFEKEGLCSNDSRCELILNLFAALAQEESHSISQNAVRSHEQHAAEGKPLGRVAYGYIASGSDRWKVNHQEARRVRMAFSLAAEGRSYQQMLSALNVLEAQEHTGVIWRQKRLKRLLCNVAYLGDFFSHRTVCMTPGHQVPNRGYRDRYYLEGHHEALVSRQLFDRVQAMVRAGLLLSRKQ